MKGKVIQTVFEKIMKRKKKESFTPPLLSLGYADEAPILHHVRTLEESDSLHNGEPYEIQSLCGEVINHSLCLLTDVERLESFHAAEDDEEFLICKKCSHLAAEALTGRKQKAQH